MIANGIEYLAQEPMIKSGMERLGFACGGISSCSKLNDVASRDDCPMKTGSEADLAMLNHRISNFWRRICAVIIIYEAHLHENDQC